LLSGELLIWMMVYTGVLHGLNPASGWLLGVFRGLIAKSSRTLLVSVLLLSAGHSLSSLTALTFSATALPLGEGAVALSSTSALFFGIYRLLRPSHPYMGLRREKFELIYVGMLLGFMHGAFFSLTPLLSAWCTRFHNVTGPFIQGLMLVGIHALSTLTAMMTLALIVYFVSGLGLLKKFWVNYNLVQSLNLIIIAAYILLTAFFR
jgi:hypothetical protein